MDATHATTSHGDLHHLGPSSNASFTGELALVSAGQPHPIRSSRHPRLLVIDDHPLLLHATQLLLQHLGYEVITASSVCDARYRAAQHTFDLVISDLSLPDGNGYDLMRDLHSRYGLKGLALTGWDPVSTQYSDQSATHSSPFSAHLVKPIHIETLHHLIQSLLT